MGLDMYLRRCPKDSDIDHKEPVAYWRKVNFLHGWIVDNLAGGVDECQEIDISLTDIKDRLLPLVNMCCNIILQSKFIPQKCKTIKGRQEYEDDISLPAVDIQWKYGDFVGLDDQKYYRISDGEELANILPVCEGLFFGNYEYNDCYAYDMLKLQKELNDIIADWDDDMRYVYRASW